MQRIGILILLTIAVTAPVVSANDEGWRARRHDEQRQLALGLCAGQALAQEGITVPTPQAGQPPALDTSTQEALQAAIQTCRSQMEGLASPTPSASPSVTPPITTSTPIPAPTPTGAPNPTPSSS